MGKRCEKQKHIDKNDDAPLNTLLLLRNGNRKIAYIFA